MIKKPILAKNHEKYKIGERIMGKKKKKKQGLQKKIFLSKDHEKKKLVLSKDHFKMCILSKFYAFLHAKMILSLLIFINFLYTFMKLVISIILLQEF